MKKLLLGLALSFAVLLGTPVNAHDIPPEILAYMTENPDATDEEFQAWIESQSDNPKVVAPEVNLPPALVQFLVDNPDALEPEIMDYIDTNPELQGWESVVSKLLSDSTEVADFTDDDLSLLTSLSEGFDERLNAGSRDESGMTLDWFQFAKNYIRLGIEHILGGLDHVLFVMVLVLLLPPWKKILAMVTTFTLAHTITLLLGGTAILTLSASIVEPLIAASIAYIAITSVFLRHKFAWLESQNNRLLTIFIFGLFHGLGFAGVFEAVAPDGERLLSSLLFFNVGVEIGQLIILAVWVPILYLMYKFKFEKYVIPPLAILVSVLALAWMWERLFF